MGDGKRLKKAAKPKVMGKRHKKVFDDENESNVVPADISKKILKTAREQIEDDAQIISQSMFNDAESIASFDLDLERDEAELEQDDEGFVITEQLDPAEEAAMAAFLQSSEESAKKTSAPTLADIILAKIAEKEQAADTAAVGAGL